MITRLLTSLILIFTLSHAASLRTNLDKEDFDSLMEISALYETDLKLIEEGKDRVALEPLLLFEQIISEHIDELEGLSESDFILFKKRMRGFFVNREEIIFVKPDNEFFLKLAKEKGGKIDVDFFELRSKLLPDSVWPAYIQPQTDYSGCTKFGTGKMTGLYGEMNRFRRENVEEYTFFISEQLLDLKEHLTGNCACGDAASVKKELQLFIKAYPKDAIIKKIKKRLRTIDSDKNFRPNCHSG